MDPPRSNSTQNTCLAAGVAQLIGSPDFVEDRGLALVLNLGGSRFRTEWVVQESLIVAKGTHWIDAQGAPRGQKGGYRGHKGKDDKRG